MEGRRERDQPEAVPRGGPTGWRRTGAGLPGPDLRAVRAGPVQGPGLGEPREHPGQGDGRACAGARVGSPAPTWGRTSDFVAGRVLSVATGPGGPDARGAHDVTRQLGVGFSLSYAARPNDPPFQRRTWKRANPGLDHFPDLEAVIRTNIGGRQLPKPGRWIGAGLWPQPLKSARSIEQIGMGSSPNQDESIVPLVPDQQPVRFDVTFPAGRPVPGQPMLPMSWVERLIRQKSRSTTLQSLSRSLPRFLPRLRSFSNRFVVSRRIGINRTGL